jgi:hypothetical protein
MKDHKLSIIIELTKLLKKSDNGDEIFEEVGKITSEITNSTKKACISIRTVTVISINQILTVAMDTWSTQTLIDLWKRLE